jgi:hypothetical protein
MSEQPLDFSSQADPVTEEGDRPARRSLVVSNAQIDFAAYAMRIVWENAKDRDVSWGWLAQVALEAAHLTRGKAVSDPPQGVQ